MQYTCGSSSQRLTVCNGNNYLNLPPNPAYLKLVITTTCPDVAPYLLVNNDILTTVYLVQRATQSVCDHFATYGRCEHRSTCTFDADLYSATYGVQTDQAESDWLASLLAPTPRTASCAASSHDLRRAA